MKVRKVQAHEERVAKRELRTLTLNAWQMRKRKHGE